MDLTKQLENGTMTPPLDWDSWSRQGFNILTPEAYQLYRKYTERILSDQQGNIQGEIREKTSGWLNTLDDFMKGGVHVDTWNLYPNKQQDGGARDQKFKEIHNKRRFWLQMRRRWDEHWSKLAQRVAGQKGGAGIVLMEQWNDYQTNEAELDCKYRWNDKIRFYIVEFLENESRDFRKYLDNPRDPSNQLQSYRWERPWVEKRMRMLKDRLGEMTEARETLRDPKWTPIDERLSGPQGWEKFWEKLRNWDGNKWIDEHISPNEYAPWLAQNDLVFIKRSLSLWKSWGPGQDVPWTVKAWWQWFMTPAIDGRDVWRNMHTLYQEMEAAFQHGVSANIAQLITNLGENMKEAENLTEPYAQQEWAIRVLPRFMETEQKLGVLNREVSKQKVEDALRRDAALQWLGWKKWWSGPQVTLDEFKNSMNSYNENAARVEDKEKWDSIGAL